jgi:hypothetical protein
LFLRSLVLIFVGGGGGGGGGAPQDAPGGDVGKGSEVEIFDVGERVEGAHHTLVPTLVTGDMAWGFPFPSLYNLCLQERSKQ